MSDIKEMVRDYIVENFLFGESEGFEDDSSFLDDGIIDSTGILELVTFLEETYGICIDDTELLPENLDTLNNVEAFLKNKISLAA